MNKRINMYKAKILLSVIWFGFGVLYFTIIMIQCIAGHFPDISQEVWGWFLPTIMPTLSLISGVLINDIHRKSSKEKTVLKFYFNIATFLSVVYLIFIGIVILIAPLSKLPSLEIMKISSLGLGPFQGLVSASVGIFFVNSEIEENSTTHNAKESEV